MGLSVHATGGFINPGWRGHMPLTLINSSRATLRLPGLLSVCQLMLVPLSEEPDRTYGDAKLNSKYMDDDGGPSYWWRDQILSQLLKQLGQNDVGQRFQERLLGRIGVPDDEVLERLERFVAARPAGAFANSDEMLDAFVESEDSARSWRQVSLYSARGALPLFASASLGSLIALPADFWHWVLWIATGLSLPATTWGVRNSVGNFFGRKELQEADRTRPSAPRPPE